MGLENNLVRLERGLDQHEGDWGGDTLIEDGSKKSPDSENSKVKPSGIMLETKNLRKEESTK